MYFFNLFGINFPLMSKLKSTSAWDYVVEINLWKRQYKFRSIICWPPVFTFSHIFWYFKHRFRISHLNTHKIQTHLQPLAMRLHFDDHAGIRLGEGIPVWNPFAGYTQLHFSQAGAVEQAQRIGCRLVDVTHVFDDACAEKERKGETLYIYNFSL